MAVPWPAELPDYIKGHLARFSVSSEGAEAEAGPVTWALHLDTLAMSLILAAVGFGAIYWVGRHASVRTPSRAQVACELLFGFFWRQVRDLFPAAPPVVLPMALTIFVWVLLMNSMDVLPVDIIGATGYLVTGSVPHFKLLPTADLSLTAALALCVFFMTLYYNLKVKGVGGFLHEVATAPFGKALMPVNVLLRCVEEVAKPLSLAMRLFGNLFAAEMIFLLIAGGLTVGVGWWVGALGQWVLGAPWAIYHILVVPLQAYIFAVLAVVYLSQACQKH